MSGRDLESVLDSPTEEIGPWSKDKLFSSKKQDWATPQALFDSVDKEFNFTLDAAATSQNAKCPLFLTEKMDALKGALSWAQLIEKLGGGAVWLNPPYGRGVGKWIQKAYTESLRGCTVVCLTFARTDTRWWHDWAMKAAEIRLMRGRVTFEGAPSSAPAPSCLLVFDEARRRPVFTVHSEWRA